VRRWADGAVLGEGGGGSIRRRGRRGSWLVRVRELFLGAGGMKLDWGKVGSAGARWEESGERQRSDFAGSVGESAVGAGLDFDARARGLGWAWLRFLFEAQMH
jgi:hypothetical protein